VGFLGPPCLLCGLSVGVLFGGGRVVAVLVAGRLFSLRRFPSGLSVWLVGWLLRLFWGWLMSSSSSRFAPFVPVASSVSLGRSGPAASVVPVRGLGFVGAVVVRSAWVAGPAAAPSFLPSSAGASALWVWFAGSSAPLVCLVGAVSPASLALLAGSVSSAGRSGVPVFPVVAAGASGVAASGYFCGLASAGPGASVAPAAGSFAS